MLSYTIGASRGYRISKVLVDGVSVGAVTEYQFKDIEADHRIEVKTTAITNPKHGNTTHGGTTSAGTDVNTGDSGQIMLYLLLMLVALAVGAGLLNYRKQIYFKK